MTWTKLATADEVQAGIVARDLAVLLLRERNGDEAATIMLNNMTLDYAIANAAFSEIIRIIESYTNAAQFVDINVEQYTARVNDTTFTVEAASVHVVHQGGRGERRTILLADPKLFQKLEKLVKELVND